MILHCMIRVFWDQNESFACFCWDVFIIWWKQYQSDFNEPGLGLGFWDAIWKKQVEIALGHKVADDVRVPDHENSSALTVLTAFLLFL